MMSISVNGESYVTIYGWMRKDLNLKGNALIVYAIIYGFSKTDEGRFKGGLKYLCDWCGASKQGVIKNIKKLIEKGLICKEEKCSNGVNSVEYYTTQFNGVLNSVTEPLNSVDQTVKLSLPNNNITIENNNDKYIRGFVAPSVDEVAAYCKEHGYKVDAQMFVDFYTSKGWMVGKNKMKDWQAAVRTWARNNKAQKATDVSPRGVKLLPEDQRDHSLDGIF